ncbi:MAG TPA: 50S ribosomal protein L24e [archaeon]|nr:50S ribosomal protein L24e [archaeon]
MPMDSFTGKPIERGRGLMYVKKDGTVYWFASKKSEKNFLKLGRNPTETKWTDFYHKEKEIKAKSKEAQLKKAKEKKA